MNTINPFVGKLTNMRNDLHFEFHSDFKDTISMHATTKAKIPAAMVAEHVSLWEQLDEVLKKIRKSQYTADIKKADEARDRAYAGLTYMVKGWTCYRRETDVRRAESIKLILDTYGNLSRKSLAEQTSATYNLVQDLRDKCAEEMERNH